MSTGDNKIQRGEWFEGQFYPDDSDDQDELPAPPRKTIPEADRQLLELAARAIGAVRVEDVEGENWVNLHFADGSVAYAWNSLMHSDDMLNLSALLRIDIAWLGDSDVLADGSSSEPTSENAAAAARRAVTRAAAEITKQRST
jgi:predicted deacylase